VRLCTLEEVAEKVIKKHHLFVVTLYVKYSVFLLCIFEGNQLAYMVRTGVVGVVGEGGGGSGCRPQQTHSIILYVYTTRILYHNIFLQNYYTHNSYYSFLSFVAKKNAAKTR
jgi:hypothetical protein